MASLLQRGAILALFLVGCHAQSSFQVQDLGGEWIAKETNYYYEFPATVPGGVYTDLMRQNIIGDIFWGYNDNSTRWVGRTNWTYAKNFTVDASTLEYPNVNLVFEGVDTFATILLNNVEIGSTKNMFVKYIFDVTSVLKAGNNTLKVLFQNPVEVGEKLNEEQLKSYRIPWECPPDAYRGECHINMIRKMQASFSWDWGPSFPSMGLWKPVYIEAFDESVIRYVVTNVQDKDEDTWALNVDTYFANNKAGQVKGQMRLTIGLDNNGSFEMGVEVNLTPNKYGELVKNVTLNIDKNTVKLWWPNGYGDQSLYNLKVDFTPAADYSDVNTKEIRVGFRTVELVQDDLENGATFYFRVNGVPIFVKGSNEIPISILPELGQDRDTVKYILSSAQDAHMNMLRVWGGGVYESDYFYDLADELGIMIWQDFMFACSLYPVHEEFLSNVLDEVDHNVKRIYHHPSIVLYAGNNENEAVLGQDWYGTQDNFTLYKSDYVKLYISTIREEFDRITHDQGIYVSSSPSNGKKAKDEGYVSTNPGDYFYGDVHFYNYVLDPWDSNTYPVVRFCSEFGYQSLPFKGAWTTATNNTDDLEITSEFMDYRQHHPDGNLGMELLILNHLNLPEQNSTNFTDTFIYYSEILYAQAIKIETEHYRRYRSYLNDQGQGYTMGALYWQLNDVWVAPTWSSIDFTRHWKMLHYFAKDMFAPLIVTGHINVERQLEIYTVSDLLNTIEDVDVSIRVFKYNSSDFKPVHDTTIRTPLNASQSDLISRIATDDFLVAQNCGELEDAKLNCFFHFSIHKLGLRISPENYVFPGKLKDSYLTSPKVQIVDVQKISDEGVYELTITSDNIALFVWLDSHSTRGKFSENGYIQVEYSRKVYFYTENKKPVTELEFSVTHLMDDQYLS